MLQLGVAGVGQQFSSFREVLRRLRNPVEIDAVYDCVFARAETVAAQEEAAWESGLRALGRRHSVDAVLLLDPGWHGVPGLHCLAGCHKPVFVSRWLSGTAADFERLYEASTEHGVSLMPALWRRYVPAALRVQELVATEIGAVTEIEIELPVSSADNPLLLSEMLVGWLDFCRNLFRTFPIGSRFEPSLAGRETSRETTTSDRRLPWQCERRRSRTHSGHPIRYPSEPVVTSSPPGDPATGCDRRNRPAGSGAILAASEGDCRTVRSGVTRWHRASQDFVRTRLG
jgi:predicted dehydrogenase